MLQAAPKLLKKMSTRKTKLEDFHMQQSFQLHSNCGLLIYKLGLEKLLRVCFFYHTIKNSFFSLFFQTKKQLTVELNDVCYRNLELVFVYLFVSNCNKVLTFLY